MKKYAHIASLLPHELAFFGLPYQRYYDPRNCWFDINFLYDGRRFISVPAVLLNVGRRSAVAKIEKTWPRIPKVVKLKEKWGSPAPVCPRGVSKHFESLAVWLLCGLVLGETSSSREDEYIDVPWPCGIWPKWLFFACGVADGSSRGKLSSFLIFFLDMYFQRRPKHPKHQHIMWATNFKCEVSQMIWLRSYLRGRLEAVFASKILRKPKKRSKQPHKWPKNPILQFHHVCRRSIRTKPC